MPSSPSFCSAALAVGALVSASSAAPTVPTNSSWALLAWGFPDGGKDTVTATTSVVDVDLFDQADLIPGLKAAGHTVICYISAGSWESWRPDANASGWDAVKLGPMDGWDELWLDIRALPQLSTLMGARLDRAVAAGCSGIEPDNTDVRGAAYMRRATYTWQTSTWASGAPCRLDAPRRRIARSTQPLPPRPTLPVLRQ